MARIPPAVATIRQAVRRVLPADGLVLVACSGGADSLALAAAARFVGRSVGLVTVDHGLQDGSAARAADVAAWASGAGLSPVMVETVSVAGRPGGPEGAAREARYEALNAAAERAGAVAVLLGHTRDDQAETVLLALARGAGPRGLSGMPARKGIFVRPLLDVARADTRKSCAALGLAPWEDPHNSDPAFARSRVRGAALPALVEALGPAVVANLARSAELIAADNEELDRLAGAAASVDVSDLSAMSRAIRRRVLHSWALRLGAPGGALSHRHVAALDALVTQWHGQGPVHLPGGIQVARERGVLVRVP
ncbi:tRNA lysidine(34) synthetase TilS [Actinoplanes sp. Pm04-4]|uniref:tRNA(Ile)-lysidine synthase n=1 Tax=Paractinoplanes pyxinae TaxID=2997416 RepID=A0ABT4B7X0_9ACTN|nr:tRNA lysidine(34) synthetase TilS [Actinoplanes pyxinae]MCY1142561.1 tRNA lysidine(34) synthetase TilS [Actinoplanes pyxinae]